MPDQTVPSAETKQRILIMDDEDYIRNILFKMFDKFGYLVELTQDGEEAVKKYQSLQADGIPADLAILDLSIPGGMGGKDAALEILNYDPNAKVLISTGNPNDPQLNDHQECGIKGVLSKPFRLDKLMETVKEIITSP